MVSTTTNGVPKTAAEAALAALGRREYPVPLHRLTKKPGGPDWNGTGWEALRLTEAEIPRRFTPESNIGVLLGEPSGGLVDVDLDTPQAIAAAGDLLPPTDRISGREAAPTSHWWYTVADPPAKASDAFTDPINGKKLLELRSTGGQTVIPPSTYPAEPDKGHPEPERCVWHRHGEPARVDIDELRAAVRTLAAVALLGRHWPKSARHDASLALAGGLLRANWPDERVEQFVRAVCVAAADEEPRDRVRCVADTAETLRGGGRATGWPTLAETLGVHGETVVAKVREWVGVTDSRTGPSVTVGSDECAEEDFQARPWPDPPHEAAFHGLAGEFARAVEPASEADPVAVLGQTLVYFGNVIGRGAHFMVEADRHYANEFLVLVGQSSKARKGTSRGHVHRVFAEAERLAASADDAGDPEGGDISWTGARNQSGLSSGEGLIWAVRDPIEKTERVKERGEPARYEKVVADEGERDKRLLVYEPEFANVLKQTERQGNTLSTVVRQAWETGNLRTMTKNSPARATGAHVSIIGHITTEELTRYLTATESANGFGNRHLWLAVRRSKLLPEGGRPNAHTLSDIQTRLAETLAFARGVGEVRRDGPARELWSEVYPRLSADRAGLSGCLLGRAEAHVMRLALIYALLDSSGTIRPEHLLAALAFWDYAERSVIYVFGDSTGDPMADDLLRLLRRSPSGLTRTEISAYLGRNVPGGQISRALGLLLRYGRARFERVATGGRPGERWFAGMRE